MNLKAATFKLVDELGAINEQRRLLDKQETAIKEILKARGPGTYQGKVYDAIAEPLVKTFYKVELLHQHVAKKVLDKCEVTTPYISIRVVKRENG